MILTIPHQTFEVINIHLSPFQIDKHGKAIAKLTYKDNSIDFQDVSILSPPMTVMDYHVETSRLRLDLSNQVSFHSKLNTLQDYLVSTFYTHQQSLLNLYHSPYEMIRRLFYFLLDHTSLSLFVYPTVTIKTQDGRPCYVMNLRQGDVIRCVIRLQGVSHFMNRDQPRLRLHHSVPYMWMIPQITPTFAIVTMPADAKESPKLKQDTNIM
jgi:hypothetical protein